MKKNRVKILLLAIIVPALLTGCGVSPEQLAAKGIYPEEYRADSLAANIENAVLNGENKLEILYFGRISDLDPLDNEDWRRGYVCRRFVDGVSAEYEQYKGYLSADYDIVLKDADLLAAMPRDGGGLKKYRRTEDDAELRVMDMLQRGGKKALYLFESAASIEEFDKFIYDAIVGIQQKNYACEYLTDRISWVMTDYGDVTELELTVDYTEGAIPLGKMAEAVDKRSLYEAMVEAWSTDIGKEAAVLYTGAGMTEGELLDVLSMASTNCAALPCEADKIWYKQYTEEDGRRIIVGRLELPVRGSELAELRQELAADIARRGDGIMAKHKETEKLYRAAYREVISAASYDNGISDATKAENLTKEMRIGRSAYGALIEGKTVCSGYAMAYKALCDYLDLECYVIVGEQGGEGHAWNMVKIDGEKYYVDCSFADTGGGSKYCLFDGKTYKREGYKAESGFDMAEQW